ncbi:APC family permease [Pseudomonadales bacterium]|nr:APC family permease [Pseudomonadales bacterium]
MQTNKLRRVLGFWDVFFIAVGQIIGAGVVALTGIAIGMTGPSVILAYFFAGILVLVVSIPIMIAGTSLPATGAYYTWSSRVGGGWLGSIVLLLILLATISLSLFGSSFGLYLNPLFPALSVNQWGLLIIVILGCANLFGLQLASKVQMFLVLLLMSALAVYAGFAIPQLDTALLTPMFPKGIVGFITAVFLLKFATGGAYLVVGLSGEMMNPRRTVVVVMISATLAVVVIYGFVALASVGVIPWQEMTNQPLTVAGRAFLPGWAMTYFLIAGAGLAICTTLNSQFIQLPRSFMVASWDKLLPEWVGGLNRYGAPYVIILGMLAVGAMPLIFGLDIGDIARAATISASFPAFIVFWVVTQIPKKYPEAYKLSVFQLSQGWMWALFLFSEFASVVGVYFLAQDLSTTVIVVLMLWITIAVAYYPLRKRYLASKGIDLDVLTTDEEIFRS